MAELDPLIHPPARLQVLTRLSAVSEAEFATLRAALDVSDSVLSKHISALADAGYVRTRKAAQAGRRTTWIALTGTGRDAAGQILHVQLHEPRRQRCKAVPSAANATGNGFSISYTGTN